MGNKNWETPIDIFKELDGEFEVREYAGRIRFNLNGKPGLAPRQGNTLAIWRNK